VAEVNENLARFEKLKKVLLIPDEFTAQDGTLTHTMKLRRGAVEGRYRKLIEEMYEKAEQ
jgi:long-chain acyl-CoA synthetase